MLRKICLLSFLLLMTFSLFGTMTVAEKGDANLKLTGSMFPGLKFDLEAEDEEPKASFGLGTVWFILSGDISEDFSYFFLYAVADGDNLFPIGNIYYKGVDNLTVRAGRFKVPFGRMYNASGLKLMFKSRNPLNSYFGHGDDIGIATKYSFMDGMLDVEGGAFNGGGTFSTNDDSYMLYSGYVSFAPMGQIPMHESAHMGYDDMKIAIMPGFSYDQEDPDFSEDPYKMTKYGAHIAFRMQTLAVDALYYMSSTDHESWEDPRATMGFSLQAGYTIGKVEPCVRFTSYDPNTDEDNDAMTLGINSRATFEAGVNYYIDSYSSRLGLNFTNETVAEDDDDTMKKSQIDIYYELLF
ncbi:MAG: porin [Candidatus Zixiibacteriota bacterium]